ncbi:S9 family peptidase [Streptomyces mobaraensis NBRC 13819 = DSM 40847]|uniref:Acyl-peptide hydrolase n=1 Tax=Streptomyces mobaraensis (strain ATCC 29032 / DSM 40847 / JCM 4168 / NBRC 13819 / NCIMB 11159 / IPCR 16-22) TaxID=1223523 RepID=M3BYL4_STRM1|nr:prolyl oligopeptidase family serine peptidase [Streptomyces mobaraensis]EME96845.1 acyl-peptide hydrolase [Streptomyces mobaraensis NBRC 13819 = DSM 40847]QTT76472.1 S9 family peptidase [Streptomyces mobaraensis NBRC 13819 = DSM 40847]
MVPKPTAPCGTWPSPVDAALVAEHGGRPDFVGWVGDDLWWVAARPAEGGRRTLIRRRPGGGEAVALPAPWDVRTRVHEYGGRAWAGTVRAASGGGPLLVFAHGPDQRLYAWEPDGPDPSPRPLTPTSAVGGGLRWADPVLLTERGEVWCVLEEFTGPGPGDVRRLLAAVPLDGRAAGDRTAVRELTDDRHRFVTGPRLSPDGSRVAWLAWDHPRMPWDGTELRIARVDGGGGGGAGDGWIADGGGGGAGAGDGRIADVHGGADAPDSADAQPDGALARFTDVRTVLGGPEEAVAQVEWAPDGTLLAVTDRTGWWNLHRVDPETGRAVNLSPAKQEFAGPLWQLGQRWFVPLPGGPIAVLHGAGAQVLGVLDSETGAVADVAGPWTEWAPALDAHGTRVVGIAAGPAGGYEVVELDGRTGRARVVGAAHRDVVDPAYLPRPEVRTFTGPDGREVHARIHRPRHPERAVPDGELPPFVVRAHGGPTGRTPLALDLGVAYFTSRGIGVAVVDYGGSTGYGRAYRERLRERWGVVDVEDCATVAGALIAEGVADPARLAVQGGSAGGWTAAHSLAATDLYACGTMLFPFLDLMAEADDGTHDFESHYTESLIGPRDRVPERYRERSPLRRADRIKVPFLLLHGLDDPVCPPGQSEALARAARGRGVPHAFLAFEGEGHGFRRKETLVRALEAELSLYAQTFGFDAPGVPELELDR